MNHRQLPLAVVTLLTSVLACNAPSAAQPSPSAPIPTETAITVASPPSATTSPTRDYAEFTQQLKSALIGEDFESVQRMMGAAFYIRYLGEDGIFIAVSDAMTLLRDELAGSIPIEIDDAVDPAVLIEGHLAPSDLPVAEALFSTHWGSSNSDQAVVLISPSSDGSPYFSGLLYARGGFPGAGVARFTPAASVAPTTTTVVTPTANPAPRGPVIYQTDFPAGSWYTFDESDGRGQHVEAGYELQVFGWAKWLFSTRVNESEFYAELTAEPQTCPVGQGGYGLLFQRQTSGTFRWFIVWCGGLYSLHEGTGTTVGTTLHEGRLPDAADPTTGVHRLGVLAQDSSLALYFDDIGLTAVGVATMPSGDMGLYGETTGSQTLDVTFSRLTVYETP